jgi:hypothetical protein
MGDNRDLIGRSIIVNGTKHTVTEVDPSNTDVVQLDGPIHREAVASHARLMIAMTECAIKDGEPGVAWPPIAG